MGRTSKTASPSDDRSVLWRDGVHIASTALWCDSIRTRDVCFVSSADAVKPRRHGQVIGSKETLALLARSDPKSQPASQLPVPMSRPFTLGSLRLELFPTGHAVGAAGLWLSVSDRKIVYAGAVCPRGEVLGVSAQARAADTLIVSAHHGPGVTLPDRTRVANQVIDFCREQVRTSGCVLLVSSALKGLEVAASIASAELEVYATRAIHHLARKLVRGGVTVPSIRRLSSDTLRPGRVLVAQISQRGALPALPPASSVALVSGTAAQASEVKEAGAEHGFAWSSFADYNDLVSYMDATGASEVFVTGPANEVVARAADGKGRRVQALGPPKQLSLL